MIDPKESRELYYYDCQKCKMVKTSDEPLDNPRCPKCGKKMRKSQRQHKRRVITK